MMRFIGLLLLLIFSFLLPSTVYSDTMTLQASADTYVNFSTPSANYGSEYTFTVGHHGEETAALIRFDLSSLPSSATINSATMNLRWTGGSSTSQDMGFSDLNGTWGPPYNYYGLMWKPEFQVHKVNTSWGEASVTFSDVFLDTLNQSWPNLPQVKNNFFDSTVIAAFSYIDPNDPNNFSSWINLDITSQAALWYSGQTNNGLILTSTGTVLSSFFIASREWSEYSPTLTIDYTTDGEPPPVSTPEPATMLLLGFGIAGLAGVRRFSK